MVKKAKKKKRLNKSNKKKKNSKFAPIDVSCNYRCVFLWLFKPRCFTSRVWENDKYAKCGIHLAYLSVFIYIV